MSNVSICNHGIVPRKLEKPLLDRDHLISHIIHLPSIEGATDQLRHMKDLTRLYVL